MRRDRSEMSGDGHPPVLRLTWPTLWVVLAVVFLAALALFSVLGGERLYYRWYYVERMGPVLQERLGFRAAFVRIQGTRGAVQVYAITEISEGGAFASAGFKKGDIFNDGDWNYHGNPDEFLYRALAEHCGKEPVPITVTPSLGFPDNEEQAEHRILLDCPTVTRSGTDAPR